MNVVVGVGQGQCGLASFGELAAGDSVSAARQINGSPELARPQYGHDILTKTHAATRLELRNNMSCYTSTIGD